MAFPRGYSAHSVGLGGGSQRRTQTARLPAPLDGVNFYQSLAEHQATDAVYSYNMIPSDYGFRTRRGYQEWVTGMTGAVRTVIPFKGEVSSQDKLFAVTSAGIYDCTTSAASPSLDTAFGSTAGNAGYCGWYSYTNDGGDKYLMVCDGENGLYYFDPSADTWAVASDITGVAEADLVFIAEHKKRLWFVEKDTSDAWYLPVGTKGGAATKFALGNKFPHGGALLGIYNWSVDGGDGIDDLLVFVSTSGDVAIYQGTDVSSADTWQSIGTWFIGNPPSSRTIGRNIGGQLHLLSGYGLISINDLVQGVTIQQATGQNSVARKVTRPIRNDMETKLADEQWDVVPLPSQGSFMILRPYAGTEPQLQYLFNFTRAGWGFWRGMPMNCASEWNGTLYFGDQDGNLHIVQGSKDGVARDGTGGSLIEFSFLTAFNDYGSPATNKMVHYIQPRFIAEFGIEPAFNACPIYDYSILEPSLFLGMTEGAGAVWDTALWDAAIWGGTSTASERVVGGDGMGTIVGIAIQGEVEDRATLLDIGIWWEAAQQMGMPG